LIAHDENEVGEWHGGVVVEGLGREIEERLGDGIVSREPAHQGFGLVRVGDDIERDLPLEGVEAAEVGKGPEVPDVKVGGAVCWPLGIVRLADGAAGLEDFVEVARDLSRGVIDKGRLAARVEIGTEVGEDGLHALCGEHDVGQKGRTSPPRL
jgi:hypothetical protein